MPHAVTQSCVGDGSCVYACPVNCIQPTPDDPAFELAEMLFIDPAACVDCGACVAACPVDAIKPHLYLEESERAFLEINAAHFAERRDRPSLAPVRPRLRVRDRGERIHVAIVGSGPAAMYAAEEILTIPVADVTVYERLDRPYGLVRSGVAPDHRRTRRIAGQLERIRNHPRLTMRLGVEVGRDISHEALHASHHAVIYAVGSITDRPLDVPGAALPGVSSATAFVGWYNGHPDFAGRAFDLSHRRAVVIGNGNVALDVARILTVDPESLTDTEIAPAALAALRASQIEEVVVVGRRAAAQSSFTLPELIGLAATPGIELVADAAGVEADDHDPKLALLRELGPANGGRRITLRYLLAPAEINGAERVEGIRFTPQQLTEDGAPQPVAGSQHVHLDAGLVLTAIGYRGTAMPDLPFDEQTGTIPNAEGRVIDPATGEAMPRTYVVGWIKRGPTGFIGTNKRCAQDTVAALVDDYNAGALSPPARLASA
ncbi:MAG: 4Fe-4S binding protein [Solirubrobacteraceae bacterium]|nr:4Fe-4S binding protein [Solirubrobacteraceae bacterium]